MSENESELSINQIKTITGFLNKHCVGQTCISSVIIYNALKADLGDISKSRFCNALSTGINNGIISGFSLRRGRNGGIHRQGAFDNHDDERKNNIERHKRPYKKRVYSGTCCDILVDSRQYRVRINEARLLVFILNVLKGSLNDKTPNVHIGTMSFRVSNIDILELFITSYCGTESVDEDN